MGLTRSIKTTFIVLHRYTGAALCVLFAVWFISGVAMAYRVDPPLTDSQRLAFDESLRSPLQARAPGEVSTLAAAWPDTEILRLAQMQGRPLYRWRTAAAGWQAAWADSGAPASFDADALRPEAARWFGDGAPFRYDGAFREHSQWSYFSAARDHYPIHRFSTEGLAPRHVFFSSRTGEPVVATTFSSRMLYYLGPGLHYFSFYPIRNNSALWRNLVNWSSGIGAATCVIGLILGVWQLRWNARRTGRRAIPYAKRWMRWHHITGLAFGVLAFTFVLSGLFSMNPGRMFPSTAVPDSVRTAFLGAPSPAAALPGPPSVLDGITDTVVKELEWKQLHGQAYVLARQDPETERMLWLQDGTLAPRAPFSADDLTTLAAPALPASIASVERLTEFDDYYYARKYRHQPLPVLRVRLRDDRSTWYYLDPDTGEMLLTSDRGTRARRWLYNGLHSFDFQFLLRAGLWWDATIWLLSVAGLALSVTGVVISWHWLKRNRASSIRQAARSTGVGARVPALRFGSISPSREERVD